MHRKNSKSSINRLVKHCTFPSTLLKVETEKALQLLWSAEKIEFAGRLYDNESIRKIVSEKMNGYDLRFAVFFMFHYETGRDAKSLAAFIFFTTMCREGIKSLLYENEYYYPSENKRYRYPDDFSKNKILPKITLL